MTTQERSWRGFVALMPLSILMACGSAHGAASLQWLGERPLDVSADGTTVVGTIWPWYTGAYRWTAETGMVWLTISPPYTHGAAAHGVSADGAVVVGSHNPSPYRQAAFRWTAAGGLVDLGGAEALGVSADGAVVVGCTYNPWGTHLAFRWTAETGMVVLDPSLDHYFYHAQGVSADGMVIVGMRGLGGGFEACRWTASEGTVGLGDLPGGADYSYAYSASYDGSVIVGQCTTAEGKQAFRWTAETGMVPLGDLPGGTFESLAWDVSANGSVVVGTGNGPSGPSAFIWDEVHGMRVLDEVLRTDYCLCALPSFSDALAVSDDGLTIVGVGMPGGGYIVRLSAHPAEKTPPAIACSPAQFAFQTTLCGDTATDVLYIDDAGETACWSVSDDAGWLSVQPAKGQGAGAVTVTVNSSGLSPGTYAAAITVSSDCASNSPLTCPVSLEVIPSTVVTNTHDSGPGSLRCAFQSANLNAGPDTVTFNIPGTGPHTIRPLSPLPALTGAGTNIDGASQPGYAVGAPVIELDGSSAGAVHGLRLLASNCVVTALVINRFSGSGIRIEGPGNTVRGCFLGTDVTGLLDRGNGSMGVHAETGGASANTIGGAEPGARNVISGNNNAGVMLCRGASNNRVLGNYIGLGADGVTALGNNTKGVWMAGASHNNIIGGSMPGERNVIGSNLDDNVSICGGSSGNVIKGNYIGVDHIGELNRGCGTHGVEVTGVSNNTVGGNASAGEGNVISGSNGAGVAIYGGYPTGNVVRGNLIGTDKDGETPIPNSTGVFIRDGALNVVGGSSEDHRNVISGNSHTGVVIDTPNQNTTVSGNYIGTSASGTAAVPNGDHGVVILGTAHDNRIGGASAGEGNLIAYNGRDGVAVVGSAVRNQIRQNRMYDNSGLGIDLGDNGVTPNDPGDGDTGPNDLLNFPEFVSAQVSGGDLTVRGTAPPGATVEVFGAAPDPSGYGEGKTYLVSTTARADGAFDFTVPVTAIPITATATDSAGNTSEFSLSLSSIPLVADAGDDQTVEQANAAGTPVTLDGSGSSDPEGGTLTYRWTDAGGNVLGTDVQITISLPLGAHTITLTVTGQGGRTATDQVVVTIRDTTSPALTVPGDLTVPQTDEGGTPATYPDIAAFLSAATATDICDASPTIAHNAPDLFPVGTTVVTFTASDDSGNSATGTASVTVTQGDCLTVTHTGDGGFGSLRGAIQCANATPGPDTIRFDIPGNGPHVIQPLSALPDLTDAGTTIDGTSQPGYDGTPVIVLNGSLAGGANGLGVYAGGTAIQGLGITGFAWWGIAVGGQGPVTIERNAVSNNGWGIALTQVSAATVRNNLVENNRGRGIACCGAGSSPTISGNTISGNTGGGVSIYGASPILENNQITGNTAGSNGGGICCCGSSARPELRNNTISGNRAGGYGGGMAVDYGGSPTIRGNTLSGNTANHGGGISLKGGTQMLENNLLTGNAASGYGGGVFGTGGGRGGWVTLRNNTLTANTSGGPGGGLILDQLTVTLTTNRVEGNQAGGIGGGICIVRVVGTLEGNQVRGNTSTVGGVAGGGLWICGVGYAPTVRANVIADNVAANGNGGGLCCAAASPVLEDNDITGNKAGAAGGGLYFCDGYGQATPKILNNEITGNHSSSSGGGIHFNCGIGAGATVKGNTISENTAPTVGGGICCAGGASPTIEQNQLRDNVAGGDGGGIWMCYGAATVRDNNTLEGNRAANGGGIYLVGGTRTVEGNTFSGNSATDGGAGLYVRSGTVAIETNTFTGGRAYRGGGIGAFGGTLTIRGNTVRGNTSAYVGGGLDLEWLTATVSGNLVEGNQANGSGPVDGSGGGILMARVHGTLEGNVVRGNTATRQSLAGGGIWICGVGYAPTLRSNVIADNRAPNGHGGGIYCAAASPVLEDNHITGNQAGDAGGGLYFCGGGKPQVLNNEITSNSSSSSGGGIHFNCGFGADITVRGNTITGNTAGGAGGGIRCAGASSPTIEQNQISNNEAGWAGGAIWSCSGTQSIRDNTIEGNRATYGGGIWSCGGGAAPTITGNTVSGNSAAEGGGGIRCADSSPTIEANEITGNSAGSGGGGVDTCGGSARPIVRNNTIAQNSGDGVTVMDGHATISQNSIYDNTGLGIDLADDGVTPNDLGDADSGPNDLLNFPEYRLARLANGQVTAYGVAPPNSTVEVFKAAPDPSRYGEGKEYLLSVTAEADGSFEFTVSQEVLPITATATDTAGNTSEFSHVNLPPTADAGDDQTLEQTAPAGSTITLDASGSYDADDDPLTFTWSEGDTTIAGPTEAPQVEVTLQLGIHTITLTVTDAGGLSATDQVVVTVEDTAPPEGDPPQDMTVEQTTRGGTPRAEVDLGDPVFRDVCDANPQVSNDAPDVFPLGATTVTWTVVDGSGAVTTVPQVVTVVDTTPPQITAPPAVTTEQTNRDGTPANLGQATATDICDADVTITNNAPAVFPLGETMVTWTATDDSGNKATGMQKVTIVDTTPPVVTVPADIMQEQTSLAGTEKVNLGQATATDICDADVTVTNDAPAVFPLGETVVTWTATDDSGNTTTATQKVTVVDTTPPLLTVPADIMQEQTSLAGTEKVNLGQATATDLCDADVTVTNDAPAVFPLGETVVTWTAADDSGNTTTATQKVTVVDTTPPLLTVPADITVEQESSGGTVVDFEVTATDVCDAAPLVVCYPPSGTEFPLGTTVVTCTATDTSGNTATGTFSVIVGDRTGPVVALTTAVTSLWPPNHDLIDVGLSLSVDDICDTSPTADLSVTQDEPVEDQTGDGNFSPDAKIQRDAAGRIVGLRLRAERKGDGDGRVYLIIATVTDASGNVTKKAVAVTVPKSQSQKDLDSVAAQAAAAVAAGVPLPFDSTNGPEIGPKQ